MTEKIERQGMTWHHFGVVITCMVALFTCVAMIFICAGLCYRPVAAHFGCQVSLHHLRLHRIHHRADPRFVAVRAH